MRNKLLLAVSFLVLAAGAASQDLPKQIPPEYVARIKAATPPMLPQEPGVKRVTTDLQDNRFKGKVAEVVEEFASFADDGSIKSKYISSVEDYDSDGNLLRRISFDSEGPWKVAVYGYVDGMRVSKSGSIPNPNVFTGAAPPKEIDLFKPTRRRDPRFTSEYRYKYENGQRVEMQMFGNDGSKWMRYTYRRTGNQFEELAYAEDNKLNQKYVSKLDPLGNEIEVLDVAVINPSRGDRKYRFTYESFDENGNWTKRLKSRVLVENGKEILKPAYTSSRTITYRSK
jgi:hypothetical protein